MEVNDGDDFRVHGLNVKYFKEALVVGEKIEIGEVSMFMAQNGGRIQDRG